MLRVHIREDGNPIDGLLATGEVNLVTGRPGPGLLGYLDFYCWNRFAVMITLAQCPNCNYW
jgi:hypothetical protein